MGTLKSVTAGQHSFANIPSADIQRSAFDRSCGLKTTFDSGWLIPIFVDEALPGDTMNLKMSTFARLATPLHPIMDNIYMDFHFFSVPNRLLWDNWQKFCGEQAIPGDTTDYLIPQIASTGIAEGTLSDYLGLPVGTQTITYNALHHRAYSLIYNEWFRDENLSLPELKKTGDGPDVPAAYNLRRRGKRHDYFTSCLPWPQKGPSVELPLGTTAPLIFGTPVDVIGSGDSKPEFQFGAFGPFGLEGEANENIQALGSGIGGDSDMAWDDPKLVADNTSLELGVADLSTATAATINALRQAFQIQRLYERDARGGTRYTEILRSHFGVVSPDQRLQRPEYLGGGTTTVGIQTVPQTSETDANTPQGNLAGYGTQSSNGIGFNKSFVEHCVILGIASVRADLNYQQGLDRMFSRQTRWDYFWPALSHLGEMSVLNKEIYSQGTAGGTDDDDVFGYQERWAEYRYKPSKITGQMRSNFAQSLDTWHLAQDFASLPTLGSTFINETPPIARVIAVPSEPEFLFDAYFSYHCVRPMPTYSVPGMIDHF